jgi:hypothetical protein
MSRAHDEQDVIRSLGRIIGRHADWLDGRTFQRLCGQAAGAYFEPADLDREVTHAEAPALLATALKRELGLEG